jgi:LacI family transcriptional regulator
VANIRQVADRAGVSIGTVSRVLNNKPGVSEKTREHVSSIAQELDYVPTRDARNSSLEVTHFGLLSAFRSITDNPFYADVFHGVEVACQDLHINLSVSSLGIENHQLQRTPRLLRDSYSDGLVVAGGAITKEVVAGLATLAQVPMVLVDNHFDLCCWDAVVADNSTGVRLAVEHLIDHGHRHITLLGGPPHASIIERRLSYEQTLRQHGLTPAIVIPDKPDDEILTYNGGAWGVIDVLQQVPDTTAILCSNDEQVVGALRKLQESGYTVPDDISLAGFDDINVVQFTTPSVTTICVDRVAMGQLAVQLLLDRIKVPDRPVLKVTVGVELMERNSVCKPRSHKLALPAYQTEATE